MQRTLFFKILIIFGLMAIIGIPLMMIQSTISERMAFRQEAVRSIAADSVRQQTVIGPILIIPYTEQYDELITVKDVKDGEVPRTKTVTRTYNRKFSIFPNDLKIIGSIDTDRRHRGLHEVLVYSGQHAISGDFILPKLDAIPHEKPNSRITTGQPYVAMSVDDVRGIRNIPHLTWGNAKIEFEQGSGINDFTSGLHAPLVTSEFKESAVVPFSFDLGLDGIESLSIAPVGKNNLVTLTSKWPHPQFGGRFLPSPKARRIDNTGFSVTWNISSLATNAQQQLSRVDPEGKSATAELDYFGVSFIEPVNVYSQADRAVKYGLLFVALTFAAFFLFELLKQLPIHPVQYTLVGLALALFFLLLVSLSERIPFAYAYLMASGGCIVLIGFYLAHVLRDWKRGLGFGAALTLLYGVLFGLLSSENNALVMGSILLFAVLSAIMVATRKVDWYQIGKSETYDE
jgi:inner membrane protein